MNPYYKDYSEYLSELFPERKVQKISIDAGRSCPNRDGTIGTGGCIYCNNESFTPQYCASSRGNIPLQIARGKEFFARKYPSMRFIAYFQSYTFTHGCATAELEATLRSVAADPDIAGIAIGTRPDSLPDELLGVLSRFNASRMPVIIEFGAESSNDETLRRINRGHTWSDTFRAAERAAKAGLHCGLHLIAALPGESLSDSLESIKAALSLPIETLKLHQMQIIKNTPLWHQWLAGTSRVTLPTVEEYIDFCTQAIALADRKVAFERFVSQAPAHLIEAPRWNLKNYEFTNLLNNRLKTYCRFKR